MTVKKDTPRKSNMHITGSPEEENKSKRREY